MKQFALQVHGAMLADRARNVALRAAIEATVRPGDVVVDVGAGTGFLSMLAARAGARKVYAIESGPVAFLARRLVEINRQSDVVEVIQEMSTDFEPPEPADVIICETLGYAVLDERFRPSLVDARNRMLKPNGALIPRAVDVIVVPVCTTDDSGFSQLNEIEQLDFSALSGLLGRMHQRRYLPRAMALSQPQRVLHLDCQTMTNQQPLACRAAFRIDRPAVLGGFSLWFDAALSPGVRMSSESADRSNHWGQTYLPSGAALHVQEGSVLHLELAINDQLGKFIISWDAQVDTATIAA
jgi:predicted RNA methylase